MGCAAADTAQALAARDAAKQSLMEREAQLFHEADYRAAVEALRQNIEALRGELCQVNTGLVDRALVEQRAHRQLERVAGALRLTIDAPVQGRPAEQARVMLDLLATRIAGLRFVSLDVGPGFELVAQGERCPDAVQLPPPRVGPDRLGWFDAQRLSPAARETHELDAKIAEADARLVVPLAAFIALVERERQLEALALASPRVGAVGPLLFAAMEGLEGVERLSVRLADTTLTLAVTGLDASSSSRLVARGFSEVTRDAAGATGTRRFVAELSRPDESGDVP